VTGVCERPEWIDAHHHLWHYTPGEYPWMSDRMQALRRDFTVDDLRVQCNANGVTGTVAVQARQSLEETDWLLSCAESSSLIRGVVGWVPLVSPNIESCLAALAERPLLKGVRHVLHDEADPLYILRDDFNAGIRALRSHGLTYDLLIFETHLPQTIEFVDRHPQQRFVLDHIAKPRIAENRMEPWRSSLFALSERPNVLCKLSGLVTEANWKDWSVKDLEPYFDTVVSAFEPSRLMFGSDWPVITVASSYGRWVETVDAWLATLSRGEAQAIRSETAARCYRL